MKRINELDKIILFGAGKGCIFHYFVRYYENRIVFAVDNDPLKWKSLDGSLRICPPEEIQNYLGQDDVAIVVTTYKDWDSIENQIKDYGWQREIIIADRDLAEFKEIEFRLFAQGANPRNPEPQKCFVELSGICNCSCKYCCYHGIQNIKAGQKTLISWETLKRTVSQLERIPSLRVISNIGQGETFVHPEWFEMSRYMVERLHCNQLSMYTNGMLLTRENVKKMMRLPILKELTISIDGRTAQDNDHYRVGSQYKRIKENLDVLKEEMGEGVKDLRVIIRNCYPITKNEFSKNGGVINPTFSVPIPDYLRNDFPDFEIVSSYAIVFTDVEHKAKSKGLKYYRAVMPRENRNCLSPFTDMAINNRGDLLRCECGFAGMESFGNVYNDDIYELWKTDGIMTRTRNSFLREDNDKPFCAGCPQNGSEEYWLYAGDQGEEA